MNNSRKIFCLGWCKTGTTSLDHSLRELGFSTPRSEGMNALEAIVEDRFDDLNKIIDEYDYFSDYPWFYKNLYEYLDKVYPNSLFILTKRDESSWLKSNTRWFSAKKESELINLHGSNKYPKLNHPILKHIYGEPNEWLYRYNKHNESVINYFKNRPKDFLLFDVFSGDGWDKLCNFLNVENPHPNGKFTWSNKQNYA